MTRSMTIIAVVLLASISAAAQDSHHQHIEQFSFAAPGQDWAKTRVDKSPRHQEWVKNGDRAVNSFVVYPEVKNKATAVVVMDSNVSCLNALLIALSKTGMSM